MNNMYIQKLAQESLDIDESVMFIVSYDCKTFLEDDPHLIAAFIAVTNDASKVTPESPAVWTWLPIGGGGQYYIMSELTLDDFYMFMFDKIRFQKMHIPNKTLNTYYRRQS